MLVSAMSHGPPCLAFVSSLAADMLLLVCACGLRNMENFGCVRVCVCWGMLFART